MTFEEVDTGTWIPKEKGDSIVGVLLEAADNVGANNSKLYTLEVEGKPVAVWGSTILDPKMAAMKPGDLIKIEYNGKGEAKGGHNAPKLFKVYKDDGEGQAEVSETDADSEADAKLSAEAEAIVAANQKPEAETVKC